MRSQFGPVIQEINLWKQTWMRRSIQSLFIDFLIFCLSKSLGYIKYYFALSLNQQHRIEASYFTNTMCYSLYIFFF